MAEMEMLRSKIFAMDDWHLRGTPSSDGLSSETQRLGQSSSSGAESKDWGFTAEPVGTSHMFRGEGGLQSFKASNINGAPPTAEQLVMDDSRINFNDTFPYTMEQSFENNFAETGDAYMQHGQGDASNGPVASSGGDSWRSLIIGSGLLGIDEFDILEYQSLQ